MCEKPKFFICRHCGNIVGMIKSSGVPIVCCGEPMKELAANTTDAAQEKHVPVVQVEDDKVVAAIGSVLHPMTPEHHIAWVYLETSQGGHRKCLPVDGEPKACFKLCENEVPIAVYEYCNLHGLWKFEIKQSLPNKLKQKARLVQGGCNPCKTD